jgi:hypothetical protein
MSSEVRDGVAIKTARAHVVKHIVLGDRVAGAEIRPPGMYSRLRAQSLLDAKAFFGDSGRLEAVSCPACDGDEASLAFAKHDFSYQECGRCGSLYVSPRPTVAALRRYYEESEAGRLRVEYFVGDTTAARLEHVVSSRIDWLCSVLPQPRRTGRHYVDVGVAYPRVFEEIGRLEYFDHLYAAELPHGMVTHVATHGVRMGLPDSGSAAAVTGFEQLEHQAAPAAWLSRIRDLLAEDGVVFLTTRSVSGFDLQILWDAAPYIFVPEHLNLFSLRGLEILLERMGFELIELSTPGQLDVELVRDAVQGDPSIPLPRFVRRLISEGSVEAYEDFQEFLQKYRLSSHVRVAARKSKA